MSRAHGGVIGQLGNAGSHPTEASQLPGLLGEGAFLQFYHEPTTGAVYLVVKESRFDLAPRTIPLPASLVTAVYARLINDQVARMSGMMPLPGIVPVVEMGIGPAPVPT